MKQIFSFNRINQTKIKAQEYEYFSSLFGGNYQKGYTTQII